MKLDQRTFKMDDQWNIIHLPERPNGFAILLIGDQNHFVDETTSIWIQNPDRYKMINRLKEHGYVIFYSNLYGRHWGSPKAVCLLKQLYHFVIRSEIINDKIHIIAEGMGALAALQLMEEMPSSIRSVAMLSPCIDLKGFFQMEKNNRLFYKRFINELASAYKVPPKNIETNILQPFTVHDFTSTLPVKIWHSTSRVPYDVSTHSRLYEQIRASRGNPIELSLHLFEQRYDITNSMITYLNKYEEVL